MCLHMYVRAAGELQIALSKPATTSHLWEITAHEERRVADGETKRERARERWRDKRENEFRLF